MWEEIKIFAIYMVIVAIGIWVNCKVLDNLVANPPELDDEEEEN